MSENPVESRGDKAQSRGMDREEDPMPSRTWRKVLYQKRREPDNYVPPEFFLAAIERNKNLHKYTLVDCIRGSCQVSLQVCSVFLFWLAYSSLLPPESGEDTASTDGGRRAESIVRRATDLLSLTLTSLALSSRSHGVAAVIVSILAVACLTLSKAGRTIIVFAFFGLGMAPVLHRLTESISTDTIHSTAAFMLLLHLIFHNYGLNSSVVSNTLSFNAGIFAGVCLASRLPSGWEAFYLMSLAGVAFVLFPVIRRRLTRQHILICLVSASSTCYATVLCSLRLGLPLMGAASVTSCLAITLVFPAIFVHWQSYKDTKHGPWDEAVPNL